MRKNGKVIICQICGKERYYPAWHLKRGGTYCSKACNLIALRGNKRGEHPNSIATRFKKGIEGKKVNISRNCLWCQIEFKTTPSANTHHCSLECYWKNKRGKIPRFCNPLFKNCEICQSKFRIFPALIKKNKGRFCSKNCFNVYQKGRSTVLKGRILNPDLPELTRIRNSREYWEWRNAVYQRDNFTCQLCGKIGGKLHADHIKPFFLYSEIRLSIPNGRTLCVECHKKTDTYGGRAHRYKKLMRDNVA